MATYGQAKWLQAWLEIRTLQVRIATVASR
jgi:hypothetical protein